MPDALKKIWNLVTWLIVAVVLAIAILIVGGRLIGLRTFAVLSGSMEPVYQTGSLIYVQEIEDTTAIPDGTVITYMTGEDTIVTHRVVTAVPDEEDPSVVRYRTKGDANDMEDGTMVHYKNIIGTPVFTIPKLGYVANFVQKPPGTYLTICFGALFVLMLFMPELLAVLLAKEEDIAPEAKAEAKPRKEKKPKKEKTLKEPKAKKEKPVKEPKLPKEKPVKEPKPRKEKPVKEVKPLISKAQPVVETPMELAQAPAVEARPKPVSSVEEFGLEQILAEEKESTRRTERGGRHELPTKSRHQSNNKKKGGAHVIKK